MGCPVVMLAAGWPVPVLERFAAGYLVVSANAILQLLFILLPFL